jgi:hypothetical protein
LLHKVGVWSRHQDKLQVKSFPRHLNVAPISARNGNDFRLETPNVCQTLLQLAELLEAWLSAMADVKDQKDVLTPIV